MQLDSADRVPRDKVNKPHPTGRLQVQSMALTICALNYFREKNVVRDDNAFERQNNTR